MIALAGAVLGEVSRPIPLRIGRVCISACAGIAECPGGSLAPAALIADADAALYVAKARGSGSWAVYGAALDAERQQAS
jgi:predicted signal transduction protein with EAL and GGDEF domain